MKKQTLACISIWVATALSLPGFSQTLGVSPEQAAVQAGKSFDLTGALGVSQAQPVAASGQTGGSAFSQLTTLGASGAKSAETKARHQPSVPSPSTGAPIKNDPSDDLRQRWEERGRGIGQIIGASAGSAVGFAAGLPSIVGAVAAGFLLGYAGYKAGGVVGAAVGYAAATVKSAVDKFAADVKMFGQEVRQYCADLKAWWDKRPHLGHPQPNNP